MTTNNYMIYALYVLISDPSVQQPGIRVARFLPKRPGQPEHIVSKDTNRATQMPYKATS